MNVLFVSLGCDKNLVDSEVMLGLLRDRGYSLTNEEAEADVIVVNTCCFIHDAKEESIQTILEMAEYKKLGRLQVLLVAGCLAQRYQTEILNEIPEVDAVIGTTATNKIVEAIEEVLEGKKAECYADLQALPLPETNRVNTTGGYYSYLKIAEGCDKFCTYCIIPSLRGKFRSVPMERLIKEARFLAEGGVKELTLIAQETTVYGVDLYGKKMLPELLDKLCEIEGIEWIRLLYCYPEEITEELIETMKRQPKICHYLDMPIQHAADTVLKRMGRRTTHKELIALITKLRKEIPDIALRTSLITGFPGETEEEHQELLEFVKEAGFERLGVFTYSKEENTPAAKMKGQITKKVKVQRQKELMKLQQQISKKRGEEKVGRTIRVMIEGKLPEDDIFIGRSYMDAPNVDGFVFVHSKDSYLSGEFVDVKITQAKEYDLVGEAISDWD
ncbi:MAG: 30S ribosomal protein S12 methylthiotransferase RimO [Lachnospiraceae bacterium]|nr:30S ribosomal protein S12 methylthiotransferase RimO [Lachnospiraceae bacterium]MBP3567846.1 30S ribosomal protein S12 methylthiotransferase RimO [Lachnospiraceae bacterium]